MDKEINIIFSAHAKEMLKERNISEDLVLYSIKNYDYKEIRSVCNLHFFKFIKQQNKVLHIVVNHNIIPNKIVTVYYDRKAKKLLNL